MKTIVEEPSSVTFNQTWTPRPSEAYDKNYTTQSNTCMCSQSIFFDEINISLDNSVKHITLQMLKQHEEKFLECNKVRLFGDAFLKKYNLSIMCFGILPIVLKFKFIVALIVSNIGYYICYPGGLLDEMAFRPYLFSFFTVIYAVCTISSVHLVMSVIINLDNKENENDISNFFKVVRQYFVNKENELKELNDELQYWQGWER